jgi:hypothetical protein
VRTDSDGYVKLAPREAQILRLLCSEASPAHRARPDPDLRTVMLHLARAWRDGLGIWTCGVILIWGLQHPEAMRGEGAKQLGSTDRTICVIYEPNLLITHSYSPIEAGGFSLQFLPSATICQRGLSRETPRTSPHLRRQTNPTSSDCALPVDSQPTGFSGNGQFVGNLALLKKTLRAVERPKSALSGPPGASLSLSPTWRARLVNSRSCGLHLDERRFSQTSVVGYWPAVNQRYGSLATVMTTGSITTAVHRELA